MDQMVSTQDFKVPSWILKKAYFATTDEYHHVLEAFRLSNRSFNEKNQLLGLILSCKHNDRIVHRYQEDLNQACIEFNLRN